MEKGIVTGGTRFIKGMMKRVDLHLFGKEAQGPRMGMGIASVVEGFKVAKCRVAMTYRDSYHDLVRQEGVTTSSSFKWEANTSITQAESMLQLHDIIGTPCTGRQGLGASHFLKWGKADFKGRRAMIQEEIWDLVEESQKDQGQCS